jgi:glycosyltransferase involved in cell wall biosynthesis
MPEPRVAVVVPIGKQPAPAAQALESALRQQTPFDFRVAAVNGACPYEEADRLGRAYAASRPDRLLYVRCENGGPGAARNAGLDVALRRWPSVEAVLFLDAEDRLGPQALATAYHALTNAPDAAWVFFDVVHAGSGPGRRDTSGAWSVLELLASDYAARGSLIRRQVFERGWRFDEKADPDLAAWDLCLRCVEAGLHGCHAPGVEYVRHAADAPPPEGPDDPARAWLRGRHAALFTQRRAVELEQDEFPRYAIYLCDAGRVVFTTDPRVPLAANGRGRRAVSFPAVELGDRLLRALADPRHERFPARFVVTSEAFLRTAADGRFAAGLFWLAQLRLERTGADLVTVRLRQRMAADYCLQLLPAARLVPPGEGIGFALLSTETLVDRLWDDGGDWLRSLFTPTPRPRVEALDVRFGRPRPPAVVPADVLGRLGRLLAEAGPAFRHAPRRAPPPSAESARAGGDGCRLTRRIFHRAALYPLVPDRSRLHVGFAAHVCDIGGSERVALNLAREARARGWAPHLFVAGSAVARLLPEFTGVFESVTVVDRWEDWYTEAMVGLMGGMDAVVAYNCWLFNEAMAPLRRLGVKTFSLLHSVGLVLQGRPNLVSFDTRGLVQDLDGVMVISKKLLRWCAAHGVPREKLVYLPNAPSFAASDALVQTTMSERAGRGPDLPLRVLFLGRFDPEKGMDRLTALVEESRRRGLPVEWRVVGRKVISEGSSGVDLRPVEPFLRPAALSAAALGGHYRWADVVVMVSRLEGVPLTLLEAQRFGCVVLSTDVGAVAEAVEHGRTGFLFANDQDVPALVDAMLQTLQELHADRGRLLDVARASAALRREATWARTFASFARAVEAALGRPKAAPRTAEKAA